VFMPSHSISGSCGSSISSFLGNLQNVQTAHTAQYQKNEQPDQKVGQRIKQTFLQRRHTDG